MRKVRLIIKREYLTRVKTKAFIISTAIVPLIAIGFFVMIAFVANHQPNQTLRIAILDDTGSLAPSISRNLDAKLPSGLPEFSVVESVERPASLEDAERDLRAQINAGSLDAYLLIPRDTAQSVEAHTRNPDNFHVIAPLTAAVNEALIEQRLSARGIHVDDVAGLVHAADLKVIKVGKSGESASHGEEIGIAIGLVMLLYTSLLMYGVTTMRSVLEEKTTRTMEVLISAVRPFQLLCGKVLGVAAVAFTQFLIWVVFFALLFTFGAMTAGLFMSDSSTSIHLPLALLIYALIYFVLGYFLYSSFFAAIGAACSNEQDAQQLQWPATMPLIFSVVVLSLILNDPASKTSIVLSEIPFFSPVLMMLRIAVEPPPLWQIVLSIALMLVTTAGVIYASARIYRIGVLMYGKRPTLPELVRWMRCS
jgi:ABC-2 type transport system permease protein